MISLHCKIKQFFLIFFNAGIILFFCSEISLAETVFSTKKPSDFPIWGKEQAIKKFTLPPIPLSQAEAHQIPITQRVLIKKINILGNTLISHSELSKISKPYLNRKLSYADLQKLRDVLTTSYLKKGYISSGAVLPEQKIINNTVEFHIIQGKLNTLKIKTDGRFPKNYIKKRLQKAADPSVNIIALEQQLQLLQRDNRIRKIAAELVPADQFGESDLYVSLEEERPFSISLGVNNIHSPTIGAETGQFSLYHGNVTGIGDQFFVGFNYTEGLNDLATQYEIPLHSSGTSLDLHFQWVESEIVDKNFADLNIESRAQTYGVTLKQTVFQSLENHLELFLTGEYRKTKSFLLGSGFSFSDGPENGVSKISVLRFGQNWLYNDNRQVFAARTTISLGLAILGATQNSDNTADGQFLHILGQLQWARKFDFIHSKIIVRTDFQFSDSALLGVEQFSVGGFGTVRGYRENLLVGDNGLVGSIEYRVAIWQSSSPAILIELASFVDAGYSNNHDRPTNGSSTLTSAGLGLLGSFSKYASFQFYWGHAFREIKLFQESDIQDDGFHFATQFNW